MKKFLLKLLAFVIVLGLVVIPINIIVDPYNIFHASLIVDNGVEPNKNYIKTKFVLEHKDEYDSYLFGSSRAGFYDVSKLPDGNWYNMSYSEGLPKEQTETLRSMISQGEIPKQVFLSLDNIAYLVDPAYHEGQLYRKAFPYTGSLKEKVGFFTSYMDTITTLESLELIKDYEGDSESLRKRMYSTGCEDLSKEQKFIGDESKGYWSEYYWPRKDAALAEIKEFVDLCNEYGIKLTVFTNPIYFETYNKGLDSGYLEFLYELSYVTEFYNFSGYNRISTDVSYYYENSHFTAEAGDIILDALYHGTSEDDVEGHAFGMYVTADNRDQFGFILLHEAVSSGRINYEYFKSYNDYPFLNQ